MSGLRLPRHRATTAQACVLFPAVAPGGDDTPAACLGIDVLGGGHFRFDPFVAYAAGRLTNPNLLVLGEPGAGKSAAVKTMVHRWARSGGRDDRGRWVGICDPKGEYRGLAHALGLPVVHLRPGGSVRLNPLDPGPAPDDALSLRRTGMLTALLVTLLHRELAPVEDAALGWVADEVSEPGAQPPTLIDVARLLASPSAAMTGRAEMSRPDLARSLEALRFGLGKLLDRDLRGMFDGPSTVRLAPGGPGVVLDLSGVHHDRDALALVMVAATAWLQGAIAARDGRQKIQVVDEAWALLATPGAVRHLQASWKLCRDYGVANVAVAHRVGDLRAQADDGTALAKVAAGLLADTQTRVVFRQAPDQVAETKTLLDLRQVEADLVSRLARGRAIWRTGREATLVQHLIAPSEWIFCDTDGALLGERSGHVPREDSNLSSRSEVFVELVPFVRHTPGCPPLKTRLEIMSSPSNRPFCPDSSSPRRRPC